MARKKQNSSISLPNGRKRTVSPGFFTDAALLSLSPLHRIFFQGLFIFADRAGRLLYRPIDLKIRILPMDSFDPVQGLADLEAKGLVRIYSDGPLKVIALKPRAWNEVQRLHPDEPDSALPAPPDKDGVWSNSHENGPKSIPVIGNDPSSPISVHGNASVDPIPGTGSSGSSCLRDPRAFVPAGSKGPSENISPTTTSDRSLEDVRKPPRLVVVGKKKALTLEDLTPEQRRTWEFIQDGRQRARQLLRETAPPDAFPAWSDRLDAEHITPPQVDHALALYLRDEHFADRLWPTVVFIAEGVFWQRLPKPPREAAR